VQSPLRDRVTRPLATSWQHTIQTKKNLQRLHHRQHLLNQSDEKQCTRERYQRYDSVADTVADTSRQPARLKQKCRKDDDHDRHERQRVQAVDQGGVKRLSLLMQCEHGEEEHQKKDGVEGVHRTAVRRQGPHDQRKAARRR
jgi:hypothetical protein